MGSGAREVRRSPRRSQKRHAYRPFVATHCFPAPSKRRTHMKEGFAVSSTAPLTGNRARVRRYRARHRRIDYVPTSDVLRIIQHHMNIGTDPCLAGVIDYLLRRQRGFLPPAACQVCAWDRSLCPRQMAVCDMPGSYLAWEGFHLKVHESDGCVRQHDARGICP